MTRHWQCRNLTTHFHLTMQGNILHREQSCRCSPTCTAYNLKKSRQVRIFICLPQYALRAYTPSVKQEQGHRNQGVDGQSCAIVSQLPLWQVSSCALLVTPQCVLLPGECGELAWSIVALLVAPLFGVQWGPDSFCASFCSGWPAPKMTPQRKDTVAEG
jgi:hypothetical protein